jgi:undecaprenyl-diphosphatase
MSRLAERGRSWSRHEWDVLAFRWVTNTHASPASVRLAILVARWSWVPLLLLVCVVAWQSQMGFAVAMQCLCIAGLAQLACKRLAARWHTSRPFSLGLCPNHLNHGPSAACPSAHALVMGVVTAFMACLAPGELLWMLMGLIALCTAWARVYVGAHFPSDVLLGLALGALVGAGAARWHL